jgi:hypothetical protein
MVGVPVKAYGFGGLRAPDGTSMTREQFGSVKVGDAAWYGKQRYTVLEVDGERARLDLPAEYDSPWVHWSMLGYRKPAKAVAAA